MVVVEATHEHVVVADPAIGFLLYNPVEFSHVWDGIALLVQPQDLNPSLEREAQVW